MTFPLPCLAPPSTAVRSSYLDGHATRMLGLGLAKARESGLDRVLLTVAPTNAPSLAVIGHNGGVADGANPDGEPRFWIDTRW